MSFEYTAIITKDEDWWLGWIEEIPGANAQERTNRTCAGQWLCCQLYGVELFEYGHNNNCLERWDQFKNGFQNV